MKSDHKKILSDVFAEVIEKLAFMFSEEVEKEELTESSKNFIKAIMTFTGALTGTLTIVVSENMCSEIAVNILGMDQIEKAQSCDALKEVLNVTCGNVLTELEGDKAIFELSVPTVSEINGTGMTTFLNKSDTIGLLVDDRQALLNLSLESYK